MWVQGTELRALALGTSVNLLSHLTGFSMSLKSAILYVLVTSWGVTSYRKMDFDGCINILVCYEGF